MPQRSLRLGPRAWPVAGNSGQTDRWGREQKLRAVFPQTWDPVWPAKSRLLTSVSFFFFFDHNQRWDLSSQTQESNPSPGTGRVKS